MVTEEEIQKKYERLRHMTLQLSDEVSPILQDIKHLFDKQYWKVFNMNRDVREKASFCNTEKEMDDMARSVIAMTMGMTQLMEAVDVEKTQTEKIKELKSQVYRYARMLGL